MSILSVKTKFSRANIKHNVFKNKIFLFKQNKLFLHIANPSHPTPP